VPGRTDTARPGPLAERAWLLTVHCDGDDGWQARLVDTQGRVSRFASPFELARHLARPATVAADGPSGRADGLR